MSYLRRVRAAVKMLMPCTPTGGTVVNPAPTPTPTPVPPPPPAVVPKLITVAVVNESTVVPDITLKPIVDALQIQVSRDFAPIWGIDASVVFIPTGAKAHPTDWQLGIFDTSDQAGALGYHDVTNDGLPLGKVFAKTDLQFGSSLSVTMSHELLEMLLDPDVNLSVFVQTTDVNGTIYAYEAADACEDDQFGYDINGVLVSDFVYPAWFESFRTTGPFDYQKKISKPFELLTGGYISIYPIPNSGGWTQLNKDRQAQSYRHRPTLGSRRERRKLPRDQWQKSEVVK